LLNIALLLQTRVSTLSIHWQYPGLKLDRWSKHGISWERTQHSFAGPAYGFTLDSFLATHGGRTPWSLLTLKEHWWDGKHGDVVKAQQWAKPLTGDQGRAKDTAYLDMWDDYLEPV
jgi:hypothetical protein